MALKATCHCGATEIEVNAPPASVTRCTCTFCSKRGVLWAYYPPDAVKIVNAREPVRYSRSGFNSHFHCGACGCSLYSDSPEWIDFKPHPTRRKFGINGRLFDDFDLDAVPVRVVDGKNLW
jgi:hypothetical protein